MGETNSPSVAHVSYDISPLSRVKLIILTTRLTAKEFLPLLRRFNAAEPVVEKSVIL
jgi:hypothetical protein